MVAGKREGNKSTGAEEDSYAKQSRTCKVAKAVDTWSKIPRYCLRKEQEIMTEGGRQTRVDSEEGSRRMRKLVQQ